MYIHILGKDIKACVIFHQLRIRCFMALLVILYALCALLIFGIIISVIARLAALLLALIIGIA